MYFSRLIFIDSSILSLRTGKVLSFIHLTKDVEKFLKLIMDFHNIYS
jgi:hypothetical protein